MRFSRLSIGRWISVLGLLCLAGQAMACGGGGDGDDGPLCQSISFTPQVTAAADGDVFIDWLTSDCSRLDVSVKIDDLTGIFTVGFDLSFPATLLSYAGYTVGPLLQKGGTSVPITVIPVTTTPGVLSFALSRTSPDPSVDASGSEILVTLRFNRVAAGSGVMQFDTGSSSPTSEVVLDDLGHPRPASFGPDHGGVVVVY